MRVKPIKVKYGLNQGFDIPRKVFAIEALRKEHNHFFGDMEFTSMNNKTQSIGAILNYVFEDGVKDNNLKVALYFIRRLMMPETLTPEKIELANVFYSTLIKYVQPEDLSEGRVSPHFFRSLISDSIKNYYKYPVGKEVDYRHIAGRMLSLKNLSDKFPNSLTGFDKKFNFVKWSEVNQADLLGVLERILQFYDSTSESFRHTIGYVKSLKEQPVQTTYDQHQQHLFNNIPHLLELTLGKVRTLMANPKLNKEEIEDKLDIAYYYFDKVPYDSPMMPRLMRLFSALRKQEKLLADVTTKKHKKNIKHGT